MASLRGEAFPVDPGLQNEDFTRYNSSQTFISSSVAHSAFPSSSPTSFLPSADSLSRAEAHRLSNQLKSIQEKQNEIFVLLRNHDERLKELAEKFEYDGDDETDQAGTHRQKKRKKMKNNSMNSRVLTKVNIKELTEEQRKVRNEILAHLQKKMKRLVGLRVDEIIPAPPEDQPSNKDAEDNEDDDDDDDGDDESFSPDFAKDVGDDTNKRLVQQAAYLVYKQQTNPETHKLTFEDVHFTNRDVEDLSKDVFRAWKKKYENLKDPEKERKRNASLRRGMRRQRKRQKKIDRGLGTAVYRLRHGNVDVDTLLHTDWMSDYVSGRTDLESKSDYENEKLIQAGYSLEAKGVEIWETVKPAFRSSEINAVYTELDEIFESRPRKTKSKKVAVRRVFLGRMNNDLPELAPYPFMISSTWKRLYIDARGRTEEFEVLPEDPIGFGSKYGQVIEAE